MRVPIQGGDPAIGVDGQHRRVAAMRPDPVIFVCDRASALRIANRLSSRHFDPVKGRGRELARSNTEATTGYHWDLSPDGTRIALLKHRDARVQILSLNGAAPRQITSKERKTLVQRGLDGGREGAVRLQLHGARG